VLRWQAAIAISVGLLVLAFPLLRLRSRRWRLAGRTGVEAAVVLLLFALWQVLLIRLVTQVDGAVGRGRAVWRWERDVHLPSEATLQHALRARPVVEVAAAYYASLHYAVVIATLVWLFVRHRARYHWGLAVLVVTTALTIPLQGIPVAPPRLVSGLGVQDAATTVGLAVYDGDGLHYPGQLTAMPSVHCAWAAIVAAIVIGAGTWRWRWVVLAYPVATLLVTVVTGNHYWADGLASWALLAVALALITGVRRLPAVRRRQTFPALERPLVSVLAR